MKRLTFHGVLVRILPGRNQMGIVNDAPSSQLPGRSVTPGKATSSFYVSIPKIIYRCQS